MSVVVITPPDGLPVETEVAKRHLRLEDDDTETDNEILRLIAVATGWLDGPGGWLGRCLLSQTLELRIDSFSDEVYCNSVRLPFPNFGEIVSVKYDDAAGAEQTLSTASYKTIGGDRAILILKQNQTWPTTNGEAECIRVQYSAGYGDEPDDVPAAIRHAILLLVAHLFENRTAVEFTATMPSELPMGFEALLAPYRVFS